MYRKTNTNKQVQSPDTKTNIHQICGYARILTGSDLREKFNGEAVQIIREHSIKFQYDSFCYDGDQKLFTGIFFF